MQDSLKNFFITALRGILRSLARATIWTYKPIVIGVTGSVGKTSTKIAIGAVLSAGHSVRISSGNLNSEMGLSLTVLGSWTPEELSLVSRDQPAGTEQPKKIFFWSKVILVSLWRLVARRKDYPEVLVLEYGADRPGDIKYLLSIARPRIGLITAVGEIPVHVEFYSGPDEVAREKARLIESLPAAGYAILNTDDEAVMNVKERTRANIMTFGFSKDADVRISRVENAIEPHKRMGVSFKLEYGGSFVPVRLDGVFGKTHAYAAAAAAAVGLSFGMNLLTVSQALEKYVPAESRMRFLPGIKNTFLLDDTYNASPLSMHAALDTLKNLSAKRRIAVLGDMLEIGKYSIEVHEGIGDLAGTFLDALFTVGPRAKLIAETAAKAKRMKKGTIFSFDVVEDACLPLQAYIAEGDVILLKGSHAMRLDKAVEEIKAGEMSSDMPISR
jgi:UDP-N-acetylmuramoyl-tripeptide--D-alanyl-D-alanine ligase